MMTAKDAAKKHFNDIEKRLFRAYNQGDITRQDMNKIIDRMSSILEDINKINFTMTYKNGVNDVGEKQ